MNKQNLKNQRAITLIALIITIVILLILAVVAIQSVNGDGIIKHAQDAKNDYTIAQEKEQIGLALSEWQIQKNYPTAGQTFNAFMTSKLVDTGIATSVVGNDSGPLTITMKSENIYTVDENGNITKQEDEKDKVTNDFEITVQQTPNGSPVSSVNLNIIPTIPDSWNNPDFTEEQAVKIVAKGIFGEESIISSLNQLVLEMYNNLFINEEDNPLYGLESATDFNDLANKLSSQIGKNDPSEQDILIYLLQVVEIPYTTVEEWAADEYEYEPTTYSLKIRKSGGKWIDITNEDSWSYRNYTVRTNGIYEIQLELDGKVSIEQIEVNVISNLGKYVKYDIDKDGSVEDETILWRVLRDEADKVELITVEALGNVDLTPSDFDDARTKYNNAIDLIVAECKRVTGITENIRNVGGPAVDATTMNDTVDFSELKTFSPIVSIDQFNKYEGTENGLKVGDEKYLEDYNQMQKSGTTIAYDSNNNSKACYWLASRQVYEGSTSVHFYVRYIEIDNNYGIRQLCHVDNGGNNANYDSNTRSHAVRPVLTLESGILDGVTQSGTKDDPIEIYQD